MSDPIPAAIGYTFRVGTESLKTYERSDVHFDTSIHVCHDRLNSPRGCLIHTTSGTNSRGWLQGESAKAGRPAGADALIDRSGHQFLLTPPYKFAYHAGASRIVLDKPYEGDALSEILLGIELECLDTERPTFEQYDSLADLICYYALMWGWSWPYIYYGHYGVAQPLGRRSDPVHFDWAALMGRLYVRTKQACIPGL